MALSSPVRPVKRASEVDGTTFPYASQVVFYFEHSDGMVIGQIRYKDDRVEALGRARAGQSTIYAVWPGQWRSDLFRIDDLDALAAAWKMSG